LLLQQEVGNRFAYTRGNCVLWTRGGARVTEIALIRDDDQLYSSDDGPFPQQLRETVTAGTCSIEQVAANRRLPLAEQHFMWGWPRIGQLVGGDKVRRKLAEGWQTSQALASLLLLVNFWAFASPTETGTPAALQVGWGFLWVMCAQIIVSIVH